MAVAGGDAAVPRDGKRLVGGAYGPSDETDGAKASKGVGAMSKKNIGSGIDDILKEEGIFEEAQAQAVKEVVAWQLAEAMKKQKISKNKLAKLLKTSRTQVDRILDPKNDITLGSLQRAAAMVGRRVTIKLV
jgi:antitoxin HicB